MTEIHSFKNAQLLPKNQARFITSYVTGTWHNKSRKWAGRPLPCDLRTNLNSLSELRQILGASPSSIRFGTHLA